MFPGQARDDSKMHLGNLSQPLIILFVMQKEKMREKTDCENAE